MAIWQGGSGAREARRAGGGQATRSDVPPSPFHRGSRGDHDEGLPTAEKSVRDRFARRVEGALWPSRGRIAAGRGGARAHQCRVVVAEPPAPSTRQMHARDSVQQPSASEPPAKQRRRGALRHANLPSAHRKRGRQVQGPWAGWGGEGGTLGARRSGPRLILLRRPRLRSPLKTAQTFTR